MMGGDVAGLYAGTGVCGGVWGCEARLPIAPCQSRPANKLAG